MRSRSRLQPQVRHSKKDNDHANVPAMALGRADFRPDRTQAVRRTVSTLTKPPCLPRLRFGRALAWRSASLRHLPFQLGLGCDTCWRTFRQVLLSLGYVRAARTFTDLIAQPHGLLGRIYRRGKRGPEPERTGTRGRGSDLPALVGRAGEARKKDRILAAYFGWRHGFHSLQPFIDRHALGMGQQAQACKH